MTTTDFVCGHSDFTIKWATLKWEKQQALELRRQVFCVEQRLFEATDEDEIDALAQCIVAIGNHGGWPDRVLGTVRIHQYDKGVWWGSRLAVAKEFRRRSGIGAGLIQLAVGSAHGLGCEQFFAQVQKPNEPLFQRLHWRSQYELSVRHRPHVMMQARLEQYPPCYTPYSGHVIKGTMNPVPDEIAPTLLTLASAPTSHTGDTGHATH